MSAARADFDPAQAARFLMDARRMRRPTAPLPPAIAPADEAEGIAVQLALAGLTGEVPPAGFKIGATAQRMQRYLGLTGPVAAFMARSGLRASGAVLTWDGFRAVGMECEIGVRLGADLPAGQCDPAVAAQAVDALFAAIEIVENRYGAGGLAEVGTPTLIADQVFHAGAVLGEAAHWRDIDLAAVPGHILVDGMPRGEGRGGDLLGHPMNALAWLAGSDIARAFGGLRAGQVIMLGSVTPPIWLENPCTVTVEFAGMPPATLHLNSPGTSPA